MLARLGVLAGLLALWEAASYAGLVNAFIAPPPSAIFASFEMLFVQEGLINAFVRTFAEALAAASIGSVIGISAGYGLHRYKMAGLAYTDWVAAMASATCPLLSCTTGFGAVTRPTKNEPPPATSTITIQVATPMYLPSITGSRRLTGGRSSRR